MISKLILSCGLIGMLVGCGQQPPAAAPAPPAAPKGIQINVPGANVDVNPEGGGVKVQAPGVNVQVGDKGVKVEAPNVSSDRFKIVITGATMHIKGRAKQGEKFVVLRECAPAPGEWENIGYLTFDSTRTGKWEPKSATVSPGDVIKIEDDATGTVICQATVPGKPPPLPRPAIEMNPPKKK